MAKKHVQNSELFQKNEPRQNTIPKNEKKLLIPNDSQDIAPHQSTNKQTKDIAPTAKRKSAKKKTRSTTSRKSAKVKRSGKKKS